MRSIPQTEGMNQYINRQDEEDHQKTRSISLHRNPKPKEVSWTSVSFACGGWLQFYMFGVGRALQHCGVAKGVKYAGCSAGALAAAGIVLDGDFDGIPLCLLYE